LEFGVSKPYSNQGTEVHFANFLSGGFTTMAVKNLPERKLANPPLCRESDYVQYITVCPPGFENLAAHDK
jgi:hypothetical protein